MSEGEDGGEKEHAPSQRRLEEARRRGEVPKSQDLVTAAATGGFLLASVGVGAAALTHLGTTGMVLLDQSDRLAPLLLAGGGGPLGGMLAAVLSGVAVFLALPAISALAAILAQRALVVAPEKLAPKLSRISPIAGAKNKFGRAGLFEFAKSFVKLVAIATVLGLFIATRLDDMISTAAFDPGPAVARLASLLIGFLALAFVVQGGIGVIDLLWQRAEHLRKNRMSRKEVLDEMRSSEGDPHLKAARRQRAVDIATNRMLADVATADVVVVNPTHVAVALKWDRARPGAPVCVAKGVDEIAARIRERAAAAGVPLRHDPPTARALFAVVEIGQEIRPEHYRAVAAAIRFAEAARRRARGMGQPG